MIAHLRNLTFVIMRMFITSATFYNRKDDPFELLIMDTTVYKGMILH